MKESKSLARGKKVKKKNLSIFFQSRINDYPKIMKETFKDIYMDISAAYLVEWKKEDKYFMITIQLCKDEVQQMMKISLDHPLRNWYERLEFYHFTITTSPWHGEHIELSEIEFWFWSRVCEAPYTDVSWQGPSISIYSFLGLYTA